MKPLETDVAFFVVAVTTVKFCARVMLLADKPGPPEDLKARNITENSFDLTWDEPRDNGGAKITDYIVEKRDAGKRAWSRVRIFAA